MVLHLLAVLAQNPFLTLTLLQRVGEWQHDCFGLKVRADQPLEPWTETKRLLLPVRRLIALLPAKQQQQMGWRSVDVAWDHRDEVELKEGGS